jgi:hypothetical protein
LITFLDLLCFNVYLENPEKLESYLAKLQNLAGSRPLVLGEAGLDSIRNGEEKQAEVLDWQIRLAFRMGCAGLFVFSWTDEWFRGGEEVEDWAFGLTDKQRKPKPALQAVSDSFAEVPFPRGCDWPRISVVVCTYNGARTLAQCLDALLKLNYPDYEVLVVSDGSSDDSASIAARYPFQLISTPNEGLSNARNLGAVGATGEILAYIDDDAVADADWLLHIAESFRNPAYAAVGGPNVAPSTACFMADCVDHAPGSPTPVLFTDREAEHIPGCNFTIRRDLLLQMGGFDPRFCAAGDDVDLCWRLEEMAAPTVKVPLVGSILAHVQKEYGNRARHKDAHEVVRNVLHRREAAVVAIDTNLVGNRTGLRSAREIESLIASMDLVITTRLHGLVLALKSGVPALAIDPIAGGAKISRQAAALGWPMVFRVEELNEDELLRAFDECRSSAAKKAARACAERATGMIEPMLDELIQRLALQTAG